MYGNFLTSIGKYTLHYRNLPVNLTSITQRKKLNRDLAISNRGQIWRIRIPMRIVTFNPILQYIKLMYCAEFKLNTF